MKFLILSVTAGQGHHQCAKALCESLIKKGHTAEILDSYKHISTALGETIDKGYLLSTKYIPEIWGKLYEKANEKSITTLTASSQKLLYKKLVDYILEFSPDAIICTHVFPAICLRLAIERGKMDKIPSIGIITDFTVHPFWEETELDAYVVSHELLGYQCHEKNIPEEKIHPLGIPINEKFATKIPKSEARNALGIADKDTVLVMTGSMGFGNVPKIIKSIDALSLDFQILCVCGNNQKNFEEISEEEYKHSVYTYGFVDNISTMMDAADFIITKPGGLSVSETLAKGLPMILVDPIPGQETRNREFLLNSGIALSVSPTFPVEEAVFHLYHSRKRFEGAERLIEGFKKPNSASDVADLAIKMALPK